jgi:DNA-binding transcriptional ArsR family regulator
METNDAVQALAALAQETRLNIFRLLVEQGPKGHPAGAIGERLGIPNATLSFHLKELSRAGLIAARQQGRFLIYSADFAAMKRLLGFLTENCCRGETCAAEQTQTGCCDQS